MNQFEKIPGGFQHQFARQNPGMLNRMFGSDDLDAFWLADMDFKVAQPISEEFQRLVDRGIYAYEFAAKDIYHAMVKWYKSRHQLELNDSSFLQVTGVLTGIALLIRELTQEGDGVLIQTPVYHQFSRLIKTSGRKVIRNPLKEKDGQYEMDLDDLEQKLDSGQVKLILICNPHNPVGRVWTRNELDQLISLADRYQVRIVSDEIHSDIIYPGHKFNSVASFGNTHHIAIIGSPAKIFGMQSISNGYLYIPDELLKKQVKGVVESMYLNHGNAFTTFGTIAAFQKGEPWLDEMLTYTEKSINWIASYVQHDMNRVKMFPVEGTYQVWLDFRSTGHTSEELYASMARNARLALTPGIWFGPESGLFMRMNIASPLSRIQEAFERINQAID